MRAAPGVRRSAASPTATARAARSAASSSATWDQGALVYAGNVGTGWNARTARDLHARLAALETTTPTLTIESIAPGRWSRRSAGAERWVGPELVAEVSFREWTPEGHVRHAVFVALRLDKPARDVTREVAAAGPAGAAPPARRDDVEHQGQQPRPRHRSVDRHHARSTLVRYYESIAERILPHLRDRPVSLVRAPEGITGELFFQKHPETRMPGLRELDPKLWPGHAAMLAVDNVDALVSAAQMNTIEFHTLELDDAQDRPSRSRRLRPRSGRRRDLDAGSGSGAPDARAC